MHLALSVRKTHCLPVLIFRIQKVSRLLHHRNLYSRTGGGIEFTRVRVFLRKYLLPSTFKIKCVYKYGNTLRSGRLLQHLADLPGSVLRDPLVNLFHRFLSGQIYSPDLSIIVVLTCFQISFTQRYTLICPHRISQLKLNAGSGIVQQRQQSTLTGIKLSQFVRRIAQQLAQFLRRLSLTTVVGQRQRGGNAVRRNHQIAVSAALLS
ncbi:hypothetical protein D3C75_846600 [compost metagenome]